MKNFINKHLRKIIFIAVVALIIVAMIGASFILNCNNFKNKECFENKYHTIIVTLNPISGAVVPIECYYYERVNTDKVIYFYGLSEKGNKASVEVDKKYIIMISTEEINQLKGITNN